jgi:hypothetical protein
MDFLIQFGRAFWMYFRELWLILVAGFLISGFVYVFIPANFVERYLGEKGLKPILIASFIGAMLPICCLGSLPIAITLRRRGAAMGAVLAFLVATPATSISALIVCWKLLGLNFTIYIFFAIIIMAVVMGMVVNRMKLDMVATDERPENCCSDDHDVAEKSTVWQKVRSSFDYAFVTMPKEIGVEVLIGIAVASLIAVSGPIQQIIREYLVGFVGYIFVLALGLLTYVCSTASVPMADAFLKSGMSWGQAMCYLLAGPVTSFGTILVIKKDFGKKILIVYLSIISILSLLFGFIYDFLLTR